MLAPNLPPLPSRFRHLPLDHRGYPVPAFVALIDGKYDFRVVKPGWREECIKHRRYWLCGEPLGVFSVFVIGPMCAVNRVTAEPPSHKECAEFSARACPFLTHPNRKRDTEGLPEEGRNPGGIMIERNPGVSVLWTVRGKGFSVFRADGGYLLKLDEPVLVQWWAKGRLATREEAEAALTSGMPLLMDMAVKDGEAAVKALNSMRARVDRMLPGTAS